MTPDEFATGTIGTGQITADHAGSAAEEDLGYFGPQSVTWKVHSDPLALIGGLRALLLQALHPEAMALLDAQSTFREAPWRRLQRTGLFVATVAFAPRADVDRMAARVRGIHQKLGVVELDQLVWVHACEVDSFLVSAHRSGLRISPAEADQYVREQQIAAELVGIPRDAVPSTRIELKEYFAGIRPRLQATDAARAAARVVLLPPMSVPIPLVLPARLGWTAVTSLAVGLLPAWAKRMYRLPPLPASDTVNALALRSLRVATAPVPAQYRRSPLYRDALRRAGVERGDSAA
ncbi:uncharacterized protein SAMN05892883_2453 [Jatrophihabitans sp. GAS493]|uniref:oxygenase MpaB family protein n=1 Tax=Jatrophihabitans sp. GAS493 TaxID=1907575 RepID=UPI000BBF7DE2|nr:oxygenase MpaB family protein [Jatrophihabitans sp. GAS493]SOD73164.1 uncharacterized protein SAMN05892883_2453 [Jatrophihabitans sp. GAS493]